MNSDELFSVKGVNISLDSILLFIIIILIIVVRTVSCYGCQYVTYNITSNCTDLFAGAFYG